MTTEMMAQTTRLPEPVAGGEIMTMIARAAADPNVDIDKMERLLALRERMEHQRAEGEFNSAMSAVQAEMRRVAADANNPQTRSQYASYAALDRALRPIYTRHGLSLSFDSGDGAPESCVRVVCYVGHIGGFTRTYKADMPADGKGAKGGDVMTKTHATGSAFTYGQRYLLKMIFNVAVGQDDDGNGADDDPAISRIVDQVIAAATWEDVSAIMKESWKKYPSKRDRDTLSGAVTQWKADHAKVAS